MPKKTKHEKFLTELSDLCTKYNARMDDGLITFWNKSGNYESKIKYMSVCGGVNASALYSVLPQNVFQLKSIWYPIENKETRNFIKRNSYKRR